LSFPQYSDEDVRGLLGEGGVSEEVEQRLRGGQVLVLGDVVMSWSVLKRQSEELGISWEERGSWLLVHGFLHLLGYDHERGEEEAREMEFEEDDLRRRCGLWKEVKR
jgi:rRNA maturation RNase YbeY